MTLYRFKSSGMWHCDGPCSFWHFGWSQCRWNVRKCAPNHNVTLQKTWIPFPYTLMSEEQSDMISLPGFFCELNEIFCRLIHLFWFAVDGNSVSIMFRHTDNPKNATKIHKPAKRPIFVQPCRYCIATFYTCCQPSLRHSGVWSGKIQWCCDVCD